MSITDNDITQALGLKHSLSPVHYNRLRWLFAGDQGAPSTTTDGQPRDLLAAFREPPGLAALLEPRGLKPVGSDGGAYLWAKVDGHQFVLLAEDERDLSNGERRLIVSDSELSPLIEYLTEVRDVMQADDIDGDEPLPLERGVLYETRRPGAPVGPCATVEISWAGTPEASAVAIRTHRDDCQPARIARDELRQVIDYLERAAVALDV